MQRTPKLVEILRKAEGLKVEKIPKEHLTQYAQNLVREIDRAQESKRLAVGTAALGAGASPFTLAAPIAAVGLLAMAGMGKVATELHGDTKELLEKLSALVAKGNIIDERHLEKYGEKIKRLRPTHLTAGKDGIYLLREKRTNALSEFLAKQPFKTYRHQLPRAKEFEVLTPKQYRRLADKENLTEEEEERIRSHIEGLDILLELKKSELLEGKKFKNARASDETHVILPAPTGIGELAGYFGDLPPVTPKEAAEKIDEWLWKNRRERVERSLKRS